MIYHTTRSSNALQWPESAYGKEAHTGKAFDGKEDERWGGDQRWRTIKSEMQKQARQACSSQICQTQPKLLQLRVYRVYRVYRIRQCCLKQTTVRLETNSYQDFAINRPFGIRAVLEYSVVATRITPWVWFWVVKVFRVSEYDFYVDPPSQTLNQGQVQASNVRRASKLHILKLESHFLSVVNKAASMLFIN